jgi:16S rRNA (guanine527-N7)-methyltransferase
VVNELDPRLTAVLSEGQRRGVVGPGDVGGHVQHALGFLGAAGWRLEPSGFTLDGARTLDLGSGGGLPGLVLALARPDLRLVLLDSNLRGTEFLGEAVETLDLDDRVLVVRARAEAAGHDPSHRGRFDLVVARGFGRPAVTAECGAPFLRVGGRLVVSEPPAEEAEGASRWPPATLAQLGLHPLEPYRGRFSYQVLTQEHPCPDNYARRSGVPAKRPLFEAST